MTENDMITTTRVNLSGEPNRVTRNPNIRGTPEWHAWEAGYSAARRDAGRAISKIKAHLGAHHPERMR